MFTVRKVDSNIQRLLGFLTFLEISWKNPITLALMDIGLSLIILVFLAGSCTLIQVTIVVRN